MTNKPTRSDFLNLILALAAIAALIQTNFNPKLPFWFRLVPVALIGFVVVGYAAPPVRAVILRAQQRRRLLAGIHRYWDEFRGHAQILYENLNPNDLNNLRNVFSSVPSNVAQNHNGEYGLISDTLRYLETRSHRFLFLVETRPRTQQAATDLIHDFESLLGAPKACGIVSGLGRVTADAAWVRKRDEALLRFTNCVRGYEDFARKANAASPDRYFHPGIF